MGGELSGPLSGVLPVIDVLASYVVLKGKGFVVKTLWESCIFHGFSDLRQATERNAYAHIYVYIYRCQVC